MPGHASGTAFEAAAHLQPAAGQRIGPQAGPVHQVLGTNSIGEPAASTPSISQGRILVRGAKHLFCIKNT